MQTIYTSVTLDRLPHQHIITQFFYRPDALPDVQPTVPKHTEGFFFLIKLKIFLTLKYYNSLVSWPWSEMLCVILLCYYCVTLCSHFTTCCTTGCTAVTCTTVISVNSIYESNTLYLYSRFWNGLDELCKPKSGAWAGQPRRLWRHSLRHSKAIVRTVDDVAHLIEWITHSHGSARVL